VNSVQQNIKWT